MSMAQLYFSHFLIINFKISLKVPTSNWNGMGVIKNVVRKKEVGVRVRNRIPNS